MKNNKNGAFAMMVSCLTLLAAVLSLMGTLKRTGNTTRYSYDQPGVGASVSSTEPDVDSELAYDGPYVDVIAELAKREPVVADGLRITKVDARTHLAVPTIKLASGDYEKVLLNVPYDGDTYSLAFENDVLAGYYEPGDGSEGEMRTDKETRVALLSEYKEYVGQFVK